LSGEPLRPGADLKAAEGRPIGPVDALEFMVAEAAAALDRAAARSAEAARRDG
jgi:hypothetical protein